jgi:hypothetical protein
MEEIIDVLLSVCVNIKCIHLFDMVGEILSFKFV